MESLKRVIEIHEVPITAADIPKLGKSTKRTGLPYGLVTKLIFDYMGQIPEGADVSVTEVLAYCINKAEITDLSDYNLSRFRLAVRKRLQNLCDKGRISRTQHGAKNQEPGFKPKI